jgi:hypothetical protein
MVPPLEIYGGALRASRDIRSAVYIGLGSATALVRVEKK